MNKNFYIITVGLLSLLICIVTWAMDLFGIVEECIYCRSERTIIGILGIIILIPIWNYIRSYLSWVFGFFGADVASAQIFLNLEEGKVGVMFLLAICALFIIVAQVWFVHYLDLLLNKKSQ